MNGGRFRFSAEILLKLRRRREESARRDFSRAIQDVAAATSRVARLEQAHHMHTQAVREMLAGLTDAMNLRLYRQCIGEIRKALETDNKHLVGARRRLVETRTRLLEAIRQRKALAVLQDRHRELHTAELRRESEKECDDLYATYQAIAKADNDRLAG